MMVIATLFREFQAVKDLVRKLSKQHTLRAAFQCEHVKGSQTVVR